MTMFSEREAGFESLFAHHEETAFKIIARRDRALGRWAAELLGKEGDEAQAYVIEVVRADVDDPRHLAVLYKLQDDLGALASEETIKAKMVEFHTAARKELESER